MQKKGNCENLKFSGTNGSRDIWGNIRRQHGTEPIFFTVEILIRETFCHKYMGEISLMDQNNSFHMIFDWYGKNITVYI